MRGIQTGEERRCIVKNRSNNWRTSNQRCECGNPATVTHCGKKICARCYRCEVRGCFGGPQPQVRKQTYDRN